jgi:hypothetical protein
VGHLEREGYLTEKVAHVDPYVLGEDIGVPGHFHPLHSVQAGTHPKFAEEAVDTVQMHLV